MSTSNDTVEFIEEGEKLCDISPEGYNCEDCPEYEDCQDISMEDYDETAEGDEEGEVSYSLEGDWD